MTMRGRASQQVIPPFRMELFQLLDAAGVMLCESLQKLFAENGDPFDTGMARFEIDTYVVFRAGCHLRRKTAEWDELAASLMDYVAARHGDRVSSHDLKAVFRKRVETYQGCWNACVDSKTYPALQCLQMLRMYIVGAAKRGRIDANDPLVFGQYLGEVYATVPLVEHDNVALGLLDCALKHITKLPGNLADLSKEDIQAAAVRGLKEAEDVLGKSRSSLILRATNLHKTYRMGRVKVPVLRGVDLEVRRGEWVAVLGASGSGKSTLLHLLGGLDRPDRGEGEEIGGNIRFEDRELGKMSARELDRYRTTSVGFVFQFYHLLPELTVLQNVTVAAMVRLGRFGYLAQRGKVEERAKKLLESFGLGHRLSHRPAELSGGERQRVAIARALVNEPRVLLADEPTGNLDHVTGESILAQIASHRAQAGGAGLTMVMVTHDREIAKQADRIVQLVDGRVA